MKMGDYNFGGCLYRNESERNAAIVEEFMAGGGVNKADDIRRDLAGNTDEALVEDLILNWFNPDHEHDDSYQAVTAADLLPAMAAFREEHA